MKRLLEEGVQSRLYFPCLHRQGVFQELGAFRDADYPNACAYGETAFSLPIFPSMTNEEVNRTIAAVRKLAKELKR